MTAVAHRIAGYDWEALEASLDDRGQALLPDLLTSADCSALVSLFAEDGLFRRHIDMAHHGYGRGEYRYFAYPLPALIADLRHLLYPRLAAIANRWNDKLNVAGRFPESHDTFIEQCHAAGQTRPTPLLLHYETGDFNRLHQDLYGDIAFPLQVVILLSTPGEDFTGGELVLTEHRPRMQGQAEVVPFGRGDAVVFAVNHRPALGKRGYHRVMMRHGVSRLRSGRRHTAGIIFHDAA